MKVLELEKYLIEKHEEKSLTFCLIAEIFGISPGLSISVLTL